MPAPVPEPLPIPTGPSFSEQLATCQAQLLAVPVPRPMWKDLSIAVAGAVLGAGLYHVLRTR